MSENVREKMGIDPAQLIGRHPRDLAEVFQVSVASRHPDLVGEEPARREVHAMRDNRGRRMWFETEVVAEQHGGRALMVSHAPASPV